MGAETARNLEWHKLLLLQAEPVGGGKMLGSGHMWVAPAALEDPRAVKMSMEGQALPTEALLKRYLPKVSIC